MYQIKCGKSPETVVLYTVILVLYTNHKHKDWSANVNQNRLQKQSNSLTKINEL